MLANHQILPVRGERRNAEYDAGTNSGEPSSYRSTSGADHVRPPSCDTAACRELGMPRGLSPSQRIVVNSRFPPSEIRSGSQQPTRDTSVVTVMKSPISHSS